MNTGILIIAHAPLASALRACVLHVFPDTAAGVLALDVASESSTQTTQEQAMALLVAAAGLRGIEACMACLCDVGRWDDQRLGACSLKSERSMPTTREAGPLAFEQHWMLMRAPSNSRNTSSARSSGSA